MAQEHAAQDGRQERRRRDMRQLAVASGATQRSADGRDDYGIAGVHCVARFRSNLSGDGSVCQKDMCAVRSRVSVRPSVDMGKIFRI